MQMDAEKGKDPYRFLEIGTFIKCFLLEPFRNSLGCEFIVLKSGAVVQDV